MVTTTTDANGTTHFFPVYRGGSAIGDAMAFLPSGVALAETVPTLVYFHGHNNTANLGAYLRSNPTNRDLRPLLSGKRVALIQPWGGHRSSFLQFQTSAGLTALIEGGLRVLIENANPTRPCPLSGPSSSSCPSPCWHAPGPSHRGPTVPRALRSPHPSFQPPGKCLRVTRWSMSSPALRRCSVLRSSSQDAVWRPRPKKSRIA